MMHQSHHLQYLMVKINLAFQFVCKKDYPNTIKVLPNLLFSLLHSGLCDDCMQNDLASFEGLRHFSTDHQEYGREIDVWSTGVSG